MQLSHVADIIGAAGAGPLAFVALGLLVLTYLSARWFGSERTAVRVTVFAFLFVLICAAPMLIWYSEHYRDGIEARVAPTSEPVPTPTASPAGTRDGKPATRRPRPAAEAAEGVRLTPSRFEAAVKSGVFTVYFPLDSSSLAAGEAAFLDDVADQYARSGATQVLLAAHTDRWGGAAYNLGVSQRLADAVKRHLVDRGIPESAIATEAFGENRPAIDTPDGVPEQRNRRVEVRFS